MNIFLYAFSFEHDPHIIVVMLFRPFGATDSRTERKRFGQSSPGNTPKAGRFTKAIFSELKNKQIGIETKLKRIRKSQCTHLSSYAHW